jgi:16S rRNA (guanine527-N7)-methyltransferase
MREQPGTNLIGQYFPELSVQQNLQFELLGEVYQEWNSKINVISRKDVGELYLRHVLHSLSIVRFIRFSPGTQIFDLGSGGGFPGIPLAIMFPDSHFLLCDSIAKKIKVASAVAQTLKLNNIQFTTERAERVKGRFNFVVSRAVAEFPIIRSLTRHLIDPKNSGAIRNGWICLKGGELDKEIGAFRNVQQFEISNWFNEDFFIGKKLLYIPFQ